jgi:hypothetical protein
VPVALPALSAALVPAASSSFQYPAGWSLRTTCEYWVVLRASQVNCWV